MAISTYAELQTAVANWLNRTDLTSRIPEFIVNAEADINRTVRATEVYTEDATLSCSGRFTALPSGYRQIDRVVFIDGAVRRPLTYIGTDQKGYDDGTDRSNKPQYYSIRGGKLELVPAPSSAITIYISYWAAPAALSSSAHSFFTQNPDLYLYRSLVEAAIYMQDQGRIEFYRGLYGAIFDQIVNQEKSQRYASGLTMRRA